MSETNKREKLIKDSEMGRKWNISKNIIISMCEFNEIPNCIKLGEVWFIPANSDKPNEKIIKSATIRIEDETLNIVKKEENQRMKSFNGLTAKEWTERSRSVWADVSSARSKHHLDHGATFPHKLCTRLIEMYSKEGDTILDPFLGTGTTIVAALDKNRNGIGIELTDRFFTVASREIGLLHSDKRSDVFPFLDDYIKYWITQGDCSEKLKELPSECIQLTVTSPPYADLIHKVVEDRTYRHKKSAYVQDNNATTNLYSEDERDLGNMSLNEYTKSIEKIMHELFRVTKKGGYNIWVVKDFRDTRNEIPYVDLHTKIAIAGERAGFKYHDLIIWDQNEQRRLVLLGYPSVFYVNQNHSYLVVLRK